VTIVRTADAAFAGARVAAASAACPAGEVITVLIGAADTALSHAHITAARRVDAASKIHAIRVGARVAQLILAEGACRDRVLVAGTICAATAAGCGTGVSTARAVLIALEVHSVPVCAAFRVHWYAQAAAALVIVSASEVVAVMGAHVEFGSLHGVDFHGALPAACVCVRLKHGRGIGIGTGGLLISNTRFLRLLRSHKRQTDKGRTSNEQHPAEKGRIHGINAARDSLIN